MIYHIVVGDEAAKQLSLAVSSESSMAGTVVVLKDLLQVGPINRAEGQSFAALRNAWWQMLNPDSKTALDVPDVPNILAVSNELNKSTQAVVWFWMAPGPADVCAYHWLLHFLGKHIGRLFICNLANLPFLNELGKVYYPINISEILPKELVKARKLARLITPAELEMDGETWRTLELENAGIRTHEGGKKILSRSENYYDAPLISVLSNRYQKVSKVLIQAYTKYKLHTGDLHLAWRLREMASAGLIELNGDSSKSYKDWEVRLLTTDEQVASEALTVSSQDGI